MQKFQKLLNNQSLPETLMADEKFVKEAKEVLAKEGKEINDEQLVELLSKLEKDIANKIELNEIELSEVSGGAGENTKKKPCENLPEPAKSVIKSLIHTTVDGILGLLGFFAGYAGGSMATEGIITLGKKKFKANINDNIELGAAIGVGVATGVTGAAGAGYGGYKLSKLICDKLGVS